MAHRLHLPFGDQLNEELGRHRITRRLNQTREELCKAGCSLGKKLKVPTYIFLKDALIRKFGEEFYEALCATAEHQKLSAV